ncbi:hypothetical protein D6810_02865 [Candidatus Dojkabacteria bacterium]|uniref:Uncharacterized protein n=1 Tax=Candidatus Dojkabacteria bacterium TaxID=2099670 RepID=A0A3M0YXA7_9BACT|nr:MAG: hypothetical protein D6810_02865 [Candidatus Dojkabacteria bacterium]
MSKSSNKKKKQSVFRFVNTETGEHYTVRLSKDAAEKLNEGKKNIMKFSRVLRKHVGFTLSKKVK